MANVRGPKLAPAVANNQIPANTVGDKFHEQKTSTSKQSEKKRAERNAKERLEKQNAEKERVCKDILEECKNLKLGDVDIADISAIPILCKFLKQLAILSHLQFDSNTAQCPEDFSFLLQLLKKHRYGYCNITTCCEVLTCLLKVSSQSTPSRAELLKELSEFWIIKASYENAITSAEELTQLAAKLEDKKLQGEAYCLLVKPHILKGTLKKAKLALEKCVQCSKESGDELTIGYSKLATATMHFLEQSYDQALAEDKQFLEIAKRLNNKLAACEAILHMGTVNASKFNIQESLNLFTEGLQLAREIGHQKKIVETQQNQALVYSVMGKYRKSYKIGSEMVETLYNSEDKALVYTLLCNLSVDALLIGKDKKSLELAEESLVIAEQLEAGEEIALAYGNIGLAKEKLRDYIGAIESFLKCLEFGEKIMDARIINNSHCNLGRAYEGKGDKKEAREYYLKALNMPQPPSSHWCDTEDFRFSPDYLFAKIALAENDLSTAKKYFQQVVERCQKFSETVLNSPLKICFNDTQKKPFQYLQHVLLREGAESAALLVAEMGRGRDFYDKVIKENTSNRLDSPEALIDLAKRNNHAVLFLSKLDVVEEMRIWFIESNGRLTTFGRSLKQWDELLKDLCMAEVLIGDAQSDVTCSQANAENAMEIRGVENKELSESDDDFQSDSDNEREAEGESTFEKTESGSKNQSTNAPSRGKYKPIPGLPYVIEKLSELIVRPIEGNLQSLVSISGSKPQLLVIPQGQTFNIPYSTLRMENGKSLCSLVSLREAFSFHSLSYSTSLQEEAMLQPHRMEDILIVGNPTNKKDLPFAQEEAEAIAKQLGVIPLMKEAATRSKVLSQLSQASIAHFACHGTIDGRSLILAPEQQNNNADLESYLTVEDISNLTLQANLVVLSACHTARGKLSSEGVLGLARAFHIAGAKSVVTALWAIKDNSATKKLILKFYKKLYTEPVADALANSMCEMEQEKYEFDQWGSFKILGANVKVFNA